MTTIKKYLKEIEGLKPKEELSDERKLEYLEKQLEAFQTQFYRFEIDAVIGKRYIKIGEELNEDAYVATGEEKIKESVQNLRSIAVHIEKLTELRDKLKDVSSN